MLIEVDKRRMFIDDDGRWHYAGPADAFSSRDCVAIKSQRDDAFVEVRFLAPRIDDIPADRLSLYRIPPRKVLMFSCLRRW